MDVLQCPECALKFRFSSELEEHLALEHPDFEAKPRGRDEDSNRQPGGTARSEVNESSASAGNASGR